MIEEIVSIGRQLEYLILEFQLFTTTDHHYPRASQAVDMGRPTLGVTSERTSSDQFSVDSRTHDPSQHLNHPLSSSSIASFPEDVNEGHLSNHEGMNELKVEKPRIVIDLDPDPEPLLPVGYSQISQPASSSTYSHSSTQARNLNISPHQSSSASNVNPGGMMIYPFHQPQGSGLGSPRSRDWNLRDTLTSSSRTFPVPDLERGLDSVHDQFTSPASFSLRSGEEDQLLNEFPSSPGSHKALEDLEAFLLSDLDHFDLISPHATDPINHHQASGLSPLTNDPIEAMDKSSSWNLVSRPSSGSRTPSASTDLRTTQPQSKHTSERDVNTGLTFSREDVHQVSTDLSNVPSGSFHLPEDHQDLQKLSTHPSQSEIITPRGRWQETAKTRVDWQALIATPPGFQSPRVPNDDKAFRALCFSLSIAEDHERFVREEEKKMAIGSQAGYHPIDLHHFLAPLIYERFMEGFGDGFMNNLKKTLLGFWNLHYIKKSTVVQQENSLMWLDDKLGLEYTLTPDLRLLGSVLSFDILDRSIHSEAWTAYLYSIWVHQSSTSISSSYQSKKYSTHQSFLKFIISIGIKAQSYGSSYLLIDLKHQISSNQISSKEIQDIISEILKHFPNIYQSHQFEFEKISIEANLNLNSLIHKHPFNLIKDDDEDQSKIFKNLNHFKSIHPSDFHFSQVDQKTRRRGKKIMDETKEDHSQAKVSSNKRFDGRGSKKQKVRVTFVDHPS